MKDVDREAKNVCNGEMPYATLMAMWALEMDKLDYDELSMYVLFSGIHNIADYVAFSLVH